MIPVFVDIETLPAHRAGWTPPAKLLEPVKAPANLKDPDKIAAAIVEKERERAAEIEEAWLRTSFDAHEGRLLCVGAAVGDDAPETAYDVDLDDTPALLTFAQAAIREGLDRGKGRCVVVGHNIGGFDAPWLWRLAIKHRHPLANVLPYRKWGDGLADTMAMWSATNPQERVSLAKIARFLGVESKSDGWDGSKVWPAYQAGDHAGIRAYCAQDVSVVRSVYLRMVSP